MPDQVQFCFWLEVQKKDLQAQKCQIDSKSDITVIWLLVFFLAFFWSQCHINSKSAITPSPVFFGLAVQRSSGHGGGSFFFFIPFILMFIHVFNYSFILAVQRSSGHGGGPPARRIVAGYGYFPSFFDGFFLSRCRFPPIVSFVSFFGV